MRVELHWTKCEHQLTRDYTFLWYYNCYTQSRGASRVYVSPEQNIGFCIVVVAWRNIGLELALNFMFLLSSSNLANSLRSVTVVKTFQRRRVSRPIQTIQPAIPDTVFT